MIDMLKAGLIGGLVGAVASFLINYFLVPVPESELLNGLGNGISGLISGFMGGFMGLFMYIKKIQTS